MMPQHKAYISNVSSRWVSPIYIMTNWMCGFICKFVVLTSLFWYFYVRGEAASLDVVLLHNNGWCVSHTPPLVIIYILGAFKRRLLRDTRIPASGTNESKYHFWNVHLNRFSLQQSLRQQELRCTSILTECVPGASWYSFRIRCHSVQSRKHHIRSDQTRTTISLYSWT